MESTILLLFSISAWMLILRLASSQQTTNPSDIAALKAVSQRWNVGIWNVSEDPCRPGAAWSAVHANPRVACDCPPSPNTAECRITHLKVYALDVAGDIPAELFNLTELIDLNLAQNVLSGAVSPEIGKLTKMKYLSLGINNLSGPVPVVLGDLKELISLSFSSNRFSGLLPKELGQLSSLEQLYIDSSGVSGPIPQELSNLKNLQVLWASDNRFTGKLPKFIGTLTNLTDLRIQGTLLEGPIPSSFSALTKLANLRLGDLIAEESSLSILENMTRLSILSLRNARIAGEIPDGIGDFSNLKYLDLSFNNLRGQIPNSFQNLNSLQFLYLGNNNLTGELPSNIINPNLIALDVSFNPITGSFPTNHAQRGLSINFLGTSMNANNLFDRKSLKISHCLQHGTSCGVDALTFLSSSFSVNCGGMDLKSASGVDFSNDSESLGAASFYASAENQWAVSNTGFFISNPSGSQYIATTDSQILGTLDSELYKTARVSPSSLRYYVVGLNNGKYRVDLHFAEIVMDDLPQSWKGLGRRLFDIYVQGKLVARDFNIQEEAKGSKRAVIKTFEVNVTETKMDIHFFWAGKGTCCIPLQGTYGPLVSAIHVSQDSSDNSSTSSSRSKRRGALAGIVIACATGIVIASSVFYLWWKKNATGHIPVHAYSPKEG